MSTTLPPKPNARTGMGGRPLGVRIACSAVLGASDEKLGICWEAKY